MSASASWEVTLRPTSARYRDWIAVLGTDTVRVKSPTPMRGTAPGLDGLQEFYLLDVAALNVVQIERLVVHLAQRFGAPEADVAREIHGEHGVPILAVDVDVRTAAPRRVLTLHAFIGTDADGNEGVMHARIAGAWVPLVTDDPAQVDQLRSVVQTHVRAGGRRLTLARFAVRDDLEAIEP